MYINYLVLYFIKITLLYCSCKIHLCLKTEEDKMLMVIEIEYTRFIIDHSSNKLMSTPVFCFNYMMVELKLSSLNLDLIKYYLKQWQDWHQV